MTQLAPLLDILQQPDHPGFAEALAQLAAFNLNGLTVAEAAALAAMLEAAIGRMRNNQTATAHELAKLRGHVAALSAYGSTK